MNTMYNPMDIRDGNHCNEGRFTERFDDAPECMPRMDYRHGDDAPSPMPRDFHGREEGPRCMPRGRGRSANPNFSPEDFAVHGEMAHCMSRSHSMPGRPDGNSFDPGGHGRPGNPDFTPEDFTDHGAMPHCMPHRHGMPGGPDGNGIGFGGHGRPGNPGNMPPRRPDPAFLKRRIEDSDLMELIDMAGRMAQRRPQSGPARSQSLVLSILAGREALSQRELQQMLGIQPGSLSELLSKLEGKGYLVREKAGDRRGNLLRITEEGRKAIPSADEGPEDDPFAALTDQEQDQLVLLLRKLLSNWVDTMVASVPRERRTPFPHRNRPVEL
jgi:DNA-binding MarR family transcriptional regulator